jgi:hypothetical protein
MAYLFGALVAAVGMWAGMHTGKESPEQAKKDWGIACAFIMVFGTMAGVQLL